MARRSTLRVYYHEHLVAQAEQGRHNFTNRLRAAFESVGLDVKLCVNSQPARLLSAGLPGLALFHMDDPFHARALTLRLAYLAPFWRIEKTAQRWQFEVAQTLFCPETIDPDLAVKFQNRQAKIVLGDCATGAKQDGFIYVPLQGVIREHRNFQYCSPVDMVQACLDHGKDRPVVVGLHPNEIYDAADHAALNALAAAHPHLRIVTGQMAPLLRDCDVVVTQNSSVALFGYLVNKPAILFGLIDFHHIALNVAELGVAAAFAAAPDHRPDFARYLLWFLKLTTVNAGAADAEQQILDTVRRHGWQV